MRRVRLKVLSPPRAVLLSYLALIVFGTLSFRFLPLTRSELSLVDALFTATSAITVTGLSVIEIQELTPAGQVFLMALIQIGGLGYMTLATFFLITLRRRIGLKERLILSEALDYPGLYGLVRFLRRVVPFVFIAEGVGFLLLWLYWEVAYSLENAPFQALFHSISAFNNAGFTLLPEGVEPFRSDPVVNLIFATLIILGGLGFFVINDLYLFFRGRVKRVSTHTKLVLYSTVILILTGWVGLLLTEFFHYPFWSLDWKEKLLTTFFLSVSSRTAGFSTVDLSYLSESSLFLLTLLMFVGASPGSTGGGIKTTTFVVLLLAVVSYIKGREEVVVFNRSIGQRQIYRAMVVMVLSVAYISTVNLLIDRFEEKDFLSTIFEVVSAFSTVGLSVGENRLSFCANFSDAGKLLIILTMIVGRVGILSFAMALIGKESETPIRHPEARLLL
ncbi:MAG: potassium transporter [Aquificae bacterium]|nr:potassium transporter [Aquificota bacterium]